MSAQARTEPSHELLARLNDLSAKLAESQEHLAHAQRLATLGTLCGAIAHEFNNMLTPVLSYAQLALQSPDDRELVQKALQKVVENTEKAATICSSLLGFIREDSQPQSVDIALCVSNTLSCLGRDLAKDGIRLECRIADGLAAAIRPVALQQVLLNLILNAVQAMKPSPGTLSIDAHRSTWKHSDGTVESGVEIAVGDTGCGIPPELLDRIFEPFVRARKPGTMEPGTGLGLAICRRLVTDAGGTITVESKAGTGTTFTIRLPAAASRSDRAAA